MQPGEMIDIEYVRRPVLSMDSIGLIICKSSHKVNCYFDITDRLHCTGRNWRKAWKIIILISGTGNTG